MKLLDFLVCDDIRHEQGKKVSLMGVFGDSIKLQVPKGAPRPIGFRLGCFFRISFNEGETIPDGFEVRVLAGDAEVGKFHGQVSIQGQPRLIAVPLVHPAIPVLGNTTLSFEMNLSVADKVIMTAKPDYSIAVEVSELPKMEP